MLPCQPLEIVGHRAIALLLHVHVERGEDAQTFTGQHRWRIAFGQFMLDVIDKIRRVVGLGEGFARVHRLGQRDCHRRPG